MEYGNSIAGPREGQRASARIISNLLSLSLPWELAVAAILSLPLLLIYINSAAYRGLPFDDSYISLHFARNLARHGFMTFDGETASAGATSLLHVVLLAIPIKVGFSPVYASIAMGFLFHIVLIGAVYFLGRVLFDDRLTAFVAAAFVSITGYLALDALNGMETTLFLAVTTAAVAAYLRARTERAYIISGVLAALAVLTRPEAVLLVMAIAAYDLMQPREGAAIVSVVTARRLAAVCGPSAAVLLGLSFFYQLTTGTFTPGTATAKMQFFREFEGSWSVRGDATQSGVAGFFAPLVPFLALAALSVRRREALIYVFFWVAFILMYFMLLPGGLTHYWYRYQHAFLPPLLVFAAAGLVSLARTVRWRSPEAGAAAAIGAALTAAILFQFNNFREHYVRDVNVNEGRNVPMAKYLRDELPADATIATHDIGIIGYYSEHEIIDLVGLVNPDVVEYHDGRRVRVYLEDVQPDYIVLFPSWEFNFLHIGLNPFIYETLREFPSLGEPYILYRTHYENGPAMLPER
jgi:hypothetical protein